MVPDSLQLRGQQLYAKNPLFQQDAHDTGRAVHYTGYVEVAERDGSLLVRNNAEASPFPLGRKPEDALAPLLESLRLAQGDPMYRAFSAQMESLYQVFKDLHEQDQVEIRKLLLALESQKQQLHQLATDNDSVRQQLLSRERELATAAVAAAAAKQLARDQQFASVAGTAGRQRGSLRMQAGLNQPDELLEGSASDSVEAGPTGSGPSGRPSGALQRGAGRTGSTSKLAMEAPEPAAAPTSSRADGGSSGGTRDRSVSRRGRRQYYILFLPYMLHPVHHCWRFYAAWQYSWTTRRTLWLAVAWVFVFLLAVGLLVGLLVPWNRIGPTNFTLGPAVVAVGVSHVSMVMQLNRDAAVYYAVVPESATIGGGGSRRRLAADHWMPTVTPGRRNGRVVRLLDGQLPSWQRLPHPASSRHARSLASRPPLKLDQVEADDVRDIAEGAVGPDAALYPFTIACGVVAWNSKDANYTLTVRNGVPGAKGTGPDDECSSSFGLVLNGTLPFDSTGPFYERRCQRCPVLLPGTPYVALLLGDGGRSTGVVQVRFTTSAAPPSPAAS